MSDLIDRQAAIDAIEAYFDGLPIVVHHDMLQLIKGLPSAQPTQKNNPNTLDALDCVSRQAAIDALSEGAMVNYQAAGHNNGLVKAIDVVKGLPSVITKEVKEDDQTKAHE